MKLSFLMLLFVLTTLKAKAESVVYNCDDGNVIEGASISVDRHGLTGDVSWDCLPGGAICNAKATVTESESSQGEAIYRGKGFWMIVHDEKKSANEKYKAHIIAKDFENNLVLNEFLICQRGEASSPSAN